MDTEHMHCSECECSLLHLDYKEMCTKDHDHMVWVIMVEAIFLVMIVIKLTWDCIRYRRTGHLPWVARHLCWSVPGIAPGRWTWTPQLPSVCAQGGPVSTSEGGVDPNMVVSKGSSGYITSSGNSSNSSKNGQPRMRPGGKEDSVVRFVWERASCYWFWNVLVDESLLVYGVQTRNQQILYFYKSLNGSPQVFLWRNWITSDRFWREIWK